MTMKTPDEWADEACNEMEADSKHIAECVAEAVEQAQKSDAAEIARLRAANEELAARVDATAARAANEREANTANIAELHRADALVGELRAALSALIAASDEEDAEAFVASVKHARALLEEK